MGSTAETAPEGTRTTVSVQWPVYQRLSELRRAVQYAEKIDNMTLSDTIRWALDHATAPVSKP